MSDAIFPVLPGIKWNVKRANSWKTLSQEAVSGKEATCALMVYPNRRYTLAYEVLRAGAEAELQTLEGFFNLRRGRHDTWLYADPDDNAVTDQSFGAGDGSTTAFQLIRARGGFNEPVQNLNGAPTIYRDDWQGKQLMYPTARTNLLTYSEQFDNAAWTKGGLISAGMANVAVAPDGSLTADRIVPTAVAETHTLSQIKSVVAGQAYTQSVYVKADGYSFIQIAPSTGFNVLYQNFDIANGTLGSGNVGVGNATIESVGDGWYRCSVTATANATGNGWMIISVVSTAAAGRLIGFTGDGTSGLHLWGADFKAGLLTSYIKTTTAAVTVTDYTLGATGIVTFAAAPLTDAALTWSGSYYWRCRFLQDVAEFDQFLEDLWQLQRIEFRTSKT